MQKTPVEFTGVLPYLVYKIFFIYYMIKTQKAYIEQITYFLQRILVRGTKNMVEPHEVVSQSRLRTCHGLGSLIFGGYEP
jgi:hypothetical protein